MIKKIDFLSPALLNAAERFIENYQEFEGEIELSKDINYKFGNYSYNQLIKNLSSIGFLDNLSKKEIRLKLPESPLNFKQLVFLHYILSQDPNWAFKFRQGLDSFKYPESIEDKIIRQCLSEVGLLDEQLSTSACKLYYKIIDFVRYKEVPSSLNNMQLGREGEDQSIKYELRKTGKQPFQKSLYDNSAGFDVLSFYPANKVKRIEVKASETGKAHITANEWKKAMSTIENNELYEFHFWKKELGIWRLAIIFPNELTFLELPSSGGHYWKEFIVMFKPFDSRFKKIQFN
jgi:hypothetical protein